MIGSHAHTLVFAFTVVSVLLAQMLSLRWGALSGTKPSCGYVQLAEGGPPRRPAPSMGKSSNIQYLWGFNLCGSEITITPLWQVFLCVHFIRHSLLWTKQVGVFCSKYLIITAQFDSCVIKKKILIQTQRIHGLMGYISTTSRKYVIFKFTIMFYGIWDIGV